MTPKFMQFGQVIIAVIAATSMIGSAYFSIGPENSWLYLIAVWGVLFAAFELYSRRLQKNRR
jgi:hypothetical protein